jgi:hypothetical protein
MSLQHYPSGNDCYGEGAHDRESFDDVRLSRNLGSFGVRRSGGLGRAASRVGTVEIVERQVRPENVGNRKERADPV